MIIRGVDVKVITDKEEIAAQGLETDVKYDNLIIATENGTLYMITQEQLAEQGRKLENQDGIKREIGGAASGLMNLMTVEGDPVLLLNCPVFKLNTSPIVGEAVILGPPVGRGTPDVPDHPLVVVGDDGWVYELTSEIFLENQEAWLWEPETEDDEVLKKNVELLVAGGVATAYFPHPGDEEAAKLIPELKDHPETVYPGAVLLGCICYLLNCDSYEFGDG